jgi:hypothetical protein
MIDANYHGERLRNRLVGALIAQLRLFVYSRKRFVDRSVLGLAESQRDARTGTRRVFESRRAPG